jgi:hypothetical protein
MIRSQFAQQYPSDADRKKIVITATVAQKLAAKLGNTKLPKTLTDHESAHLEHRLRKWASDPSDSSMELASTNVTLSAAGRVLLYDESPGIPTAKTRKRSRTTSDDGESSVAANAEDGDEANE